MDDPRETRKLAKNWREYLGESKESVRVYAWAWREFITPESKVWMKRGLTALLIATVLAVIQPWLLKSVIDGLVAKDGRVVAISLGAFAVAILVDRLLFWVFDHCKEWSLGINMGHIDARTSSLFFGKSLGQHLRDSGKLTAANVEKGRNRIIEVEHMLIYEGVPTIIEMGLAFLFLFFISPVAGVVMLVVLANYLVVTLHINRKVLTTCTPIDAELRKLNRHRVERWDNVERVKACGKEDEEVRHMSSWYDRVIADDRSFWLWVIRTNTFRAMFNVTAVAGLTVYGAWLVWHGDWTVGFLYPFYQWMRRVSDSMWRIGAIEHRLNWNMPPVRAMMQALSLEPDVRDVPDATRLPAEKPVRVELEGIGHAYAGPGADDDEGVPTNGVMTAGLDVLKYVSFSVEPGEKVALIGPSGAGKTTVMRLLQRYMDPEQGSVRVNGTDLRGVALKSWTDLVGYIPQQAQVLDGTLRYNLLYGLPEEERAKVSDEELWRVMRGLCIDFGERLTEGLDTVVGRRGIKLSGGQAQRLMIGSAVMRRPRFMIIDEATSSLDSTTERAVQEGLATLLPADTSALIITHRLSTVRRLCTKFVVLKPAEEANCSGRQVEAVASSFEELVLVSPTFRRLAADQGVVIDASLPNGKTTHHVPL